jgi:hypothetical protein
MSENMVLFVCLFSWLLCFVLFFAVLEIKTRSLCSQGKASTLLLELLPQVFCFYFGFEITLSLNLRSSWLHLLSSWGYRHMPGRPAVICLSVIDIVHLPHYPASSHKWQGFIIVFHCIYMFSLSILFTWAFRLILYLDCCEQ